MIITRGILIIGLVFITGLFACNSDEQACASSPKLVKSAINPNGDSELALVMRALFDDAMKMKRVMMVDGVAPASEIDYTEILEAHATEPEKANSPEYKAMAQAYISLMKEFETQKDTNAHVQFNTVVDACMGCHKVMCPGPMVKIKKLYLKD
jgi:hypothetical protein